MPGNGKNGKTGEVKLRWGSLSSFEQENVTKLFGDHGLYNIEAEQMILGALLLNNNNFWQCKSLKHWHFHESLHKEVFEELSDKISEGGQVSAVSLKNFLDHQYPATDDFSASKYVASLLGMAGTVFDVGHLAETVVDLATRRQMASVLRDAYGKLTDLSHKTPHNEVSAAVLADVMDLSEISGGLQLHSIDQVNKTIVDRLAKSSPCTPTGISVIDKALGGGIYRRKSYCITAKAKMGKTIMLSTWFTNMAMSGVPVLYICAEMGEVEIQQRALARQMGCNSIDFISKRDNHDFLSNAAYAVTHPPQHQHNGFYVDAPSISFSDLKQVVMQAVRRKKIEIIFLDYIQLVEGKDQRESEAAFQERVAKWIAKICRQQDIAIVYAAQQNREGELHGSDGAKRSADWLYELVLKDNDYAYMKHISSRYTMRSDIGNADNPALWKFAHGPYFRDLSENEEYVYQARTKKAEKSDPPADVADDRQSRLYMQD